jgi:hypothetical protein
VKLFTLQFWVAALESAVVVFASAFTGVLAATTSAPSLHALYAAAVAGGLAVLYQFNKQLGAVQTSRTGRDAVVFRAPEPPQAPTV